MLHRGHITSGPPYLVYDGLPKDDLGSFGALCKLRFSKHYSLNSYRAIQPNSMINMEFMGVMAVTFLAIFQILIKHLQHFETGLNTCLYGENKQEVQGPWRSA